MRFRDKLNEGSSIGDIKTYSSKYLNNDMKDIRKQLDEIEKAKKYFKFEDMKKPVTEISRIVDKMKKILG